jgi:flagellar protein FlaG
MRISGTNSIEVSQVQVKGNSTTSTMYKADQKQQGSNSVSQPTNTLDSSKTAQGIDNSEETKQKVQDAVSKMNEMLDLTNNTSKFMYHEGLDRYYVSVVDRETEEIVKEIPPKKLLDAFYEMQKMLGMIVDEKI